MYHKKWKLYILGKYNVLKVNTEIITLENMLTKQNTPR